MRKKKPGVYLDREVTGHWCFEPIVKWIARDYWGNWIASGKTRKECEAECRLHGYVPRR